MAERSDHAIWTSRLRQAVWQLALSGELYTNPQLYPGVSLAERSEDGMFDVLTITKGPITAQFYRFVSGDLGPIGLSIKLPGEEKPQLLDSEAMAILPSQDSELVRAVFWPYLQAASQPLAAIHRELEALRRSLTDAYIAQMRAESADRLKEFEAELRRDWPSPLTPTTSPA